MWISEEDLRRAILETGIENFYVETGNDTIIRGEVFIIHISQEDAGKLIEEIKENKNGRKQQAE